MRFLFVLLSAMLFHNQGHAQPVRNHSVRVMTGFYAPSFDHPFLKFRTDRYSNTPFEMSPDFNLGIEWMGRIQEHKNLSLLIGIYASGLEMYSSGYPDPTAFTYLAQSDHLLCFSGGIGIDYEQRTWKPFYVNISLIPSLAYYHRGADLTDTARLNQDERKNAGQPYSGPFVYQYHPGRVYNLLNFQLRNRLTFSYYLSSRLGFQLAAEYIFGLPFRAFEWSYSVYKDEDRDLSHPISYEKAIFSNSAVSFNIGAVWRF